MPRESCAECAVLGEKLREAQATFRPKKPGGRYVPDGSALTDARVMIRRHAEVCKTAPLCLLESASGA